MKKIIFALFLTAVAVAAAAGQGSTDEKKVEFFVGYSRNGIDGDTDRFFATDNNFRDPGSQVFHGFEVAAVVNVSRYIGIKGDFSGNYEQGSFSFPVGNLTPTPRPTFAGKAKNSLYNVLAGVQIKDNQNTGTLKPFAHALFGVGQAQTDINATCTPQVNCVGLDLPRSDRERGFAGAFGGGLDVRLNDHFDLRVVQFDYNPVNLKSGTLHNFRIGVGIVIK